MLRRTVELGRLIGSLTGTDPLREYCERRGIPFETECHEGSVAILRRWDDAMATLSPETRADIELELTQVRELANRDSLYHLIDVSSGRLLPPDLVPGEAAQALWFLIHQPSIFQEVYFHEEVRDIESWRNASAPAGIQVRDLTARRAAFEAELRRFHRAHEGTGRFCTSRSYHFDDPDCTVFVGYVSDRPRLLDAFSEEGTHRRERIRPARPVIFAYYPADGTVMLKCRHRARDKVLALLHGFSRAVLETDLDEGRMGFRFDLGRLALPFDPPLPEGITAVRVKYLELAYPAREGRRHLRLGTNAADRPSAIAELLRNHVDEALKTQLSVVYAELQVAVHMRGRPKSYIIRLWPDRCTLGHSKTSELLRGCLRTWGLFSS